MIHRRELFRCFLFLVGCLVSCSAGVEGVKCDLCKVVAKKVADFSHNATSLNRTIEQLQEKCDSKFQSHPLEKKACDFIVKKLIDLFPFAYRELSTLAWDSANLCAVAGICKVDCCSTKTMPEQVHISLSRNPTEMQVMWTTLEDTKTHSVWWGTDEEDLNQTNAKTPGSSSTYTHFGWVGTLHSAKMVSLRSNTKYFYKVGDANGGWSKIFSFRTFHVDAGTDEHPLRVGSVGDMGYASHSDDTIARLSALIDDEQLDMVVHNGDISYADGEMSHWDVFMRKIETVAARVPYQVTPGNHEMWFNFSAYKHRFSMSDEGANDNLFYGVHVGQPKSGVHFVGMDTESWYDRAHMSKEQVSWIDREMKNDSSPSWRIAYGHRPLYCSNHGGQDIPHGNTVLRKAVEDVLVAHKVDLVIQAHEHDYERTFPVYQSQAVSTNYTDPTKPVYVVNGAAGNREKNEKPPGGPEPYWPPSLNRTGLISYGVFTLTSNSLKWEQRVSADNSLQDSFEIVKRD